MRQEELDREREPSKKGAHAGFERPSWTWCGQFPPGLTAWLSSLKARRKNLAVCATLLRVVLRARRAVAARTEVTGRVGRLFVRPLYWRDQN